MKFPDASSELTTILVVEDVSTSKNWYLSVLGAELHSEYGGTSVVINFLGAWLLLVTGGAPTEDKPGVTMAAPDDQTKIDHSFTIRVNDCNETYKALKSRGAEFLTPPIVNGAETRAFFRDPDGHLFEISEYRV